MISVRGDNRLRFAALLLCMIFLCGVTWMTAAYAGENVCTTVRVGFFEMDGYHVIDGFGVRSGYGYDFLHLMARYSDLHFEYVGYDKSWDEMQEMLLKGEIDLLTSAQKTPQRELMFDFSSSPIGSSTGILTVKAGNERYSNGDYTGMRVGLIRNSSRNDQLTAFMKEKGFIYTGVYYDDMNALTAALQDGTDIDAAMTSNLRRTDHEWILESLSPSSFYVMVRKGDAELLSRIDAAIERMDSDSPGWRTRLTDQYYSANAGEIVAFTAEERAYLSALNSAGRALRVTMNPDCAPYSYFEDGSPKGIVADIFAETARRMGIKYEILEPADRADYRRLCLDKGTDVILDAMNDVYTLEVNGFEITDVYYSSPLAVVTPKDTAGDLRLLAQPEISVLNESPIAPVFSGTVKVTADCATYAEAVRRVLNGSADGVYMPYYCAQWLSSADVTGQLNCLMLPMDERAFVYAVDAEEEYLLLSSLNKALDSLSDDFIMTVVTKNTERDNQEFSFLKLVYRNPILVCGAIVSMIAIIAAAVFFAGKNRRAQRELRRTRQLERYIGYLCNSYDKVLEVDFNLHTRRQYRKRNGMVEIEEYGDFTSFDIASLHPDDMNAALDLFAPQAIQALFASSEDERYTECRMRAEDGTYRWHSFLLKLIPKDEEHPLSVMLLIKDIDALHREREQSRDALLSALDAANSASRSKSVFLSSISHEIRTPLNAMIGYMTIASTAVDNKEKVLYCIHSAEVAAKHLLSIINDVLDLSSMESGKLKLVKERFDIKEQLSAISTVFYQQCKQKNIQFSISVVNLTEEWVTGDVMRINQILMNLMSNAVKFTSAGGVTLTVEQTARTAEQVCIRFTVKDTGIGMSQEYLQRLFAPFEQESAQTARKYGGTGLGMPITMNLVNIMGGIIHVESKQGEGSVFTVTIPFERSVSGRPADTAIDFSQLHVLAVDNMESEQYYICALLNRIGVRSKNASSGEEALRLLAEVKDTPERFNLCIMDWNMPGLDGVETAKRIHQECDPNIPIIIATAYDISEFEEAALAAGVTRVVAKPLFQSTLMDLLVTTYGHYTAKSEDDELPNLAGMRVLLAEDNETNVEVAVELLGLAEVETVVARNGQEAVELFMAGSERYDAILMDVQMPVMDGYTATRQIRASADARAKTIPIIAMTADAFAENVASALNAGMDDHVAKPIDTAVLFAVLKKVYQKNRREA